LRKNNGPTGATSREPAAFSAGSSGNLPAGSARSKGSAAFVDQQALSIVAGQVLLGCSLRLNTRFTNPSSATNTPSTPKPAINDIAETESVTGPVSPKPPLVGVTNSPIHAPTIAPSASCPRHNIKSRGVKRLSLALLQIFLKTAAPAPRTP